MRSVSTRGSRLVNGFCLARVGWFILLPLAFLSVLVTSCSAPPQIASVDGAYYAFFTQSGDDGSDAKLDGATLHGVVEILVKGDDVAAVEFNLEGSGDHELEHVTLTSAPFSVSLDTTLLDDGEWQLTVVVRLENGAVLESVASFTIANGGEAEGPDDPPASDDPTDGETERSFSSVDVGVVGFVGESRVEPDAESVVVRASGADVWSEEDGFRFTYQGLSGDGALTVRVDALEAAHEWTKVGVMVREDVSPGAANGFMLLTEELGVVFQGRVEAGGETSNRAADGSRMRDWDPVAPWWLRIERRGEVLIGSHSPDGEVWSELGRLAVPLPQDVLIGMAVTSRTNEALATGVFSRVTFEPLEADDEGDAGGGGGDDGGGGGGPPPGSALPPAPIEGPTVSASYTRSNEDFPNPERGWFGYGAENGGNTGSYRDRANSGYTLIRRYVRLDDYRTRPLPASLLDGLRRDLDDLRDYGLKMIVRFSYNHTRGGEDAPLEWVLHHIDQLAPVLQEYTDVIAVVQAGFIGAWGEWHSTRHDLLTLENRRSITNALLEAVDESRMIQIRYPYRARDMFPTPPTAANAFDGSDVARVGQKNDCLLSSSSDGGTYLDAADYAYVEAVTPFTAMGGETCAIAGLNSRNDGSNAVVELARYHYDYLNAEFYAPVLDKWRAQGYYDEISRRLGYRYVMLGTTSQASAQVGQLFSLNVRIENEGYGKLYNPRPINIVLRPTSGGSSITLRANDDARTVMPLSGETRTVALTVRLPDSMPTGAYDVFLALPDAASTIANDPRYAIRFANRDVWSQSGGHNALNVQLNVMD